MASLRIAQPVNFLAAEALAVALLTDTGIRVSVESPGLQRAGEELDLRFELSPPFD